MANPDRHSRDEHCNDDHELDHDHVHSHACAHDHQHDPSNSNSLATHAADDIICLHDVSYRYPNQASRTDSLALKNVTLHIERGENLGIIGPNGAGKSTLLKVILGLVDGYSGSVTVAGMSPKDACAKGDVLGYVPQRADVEWRFPLTAEQVVLRGLVGKTGVFRRHRKADKLHAIDMMQRVGIDHLRDRPIGQLSGGQQQRIFIARALAAGPSILLFDEPLVGVDESGQQQFAQLMHELHESLHLTIVLVSHDIQAIAAGCNRVACLKQSIHYHDAPAGLTREVLDEVFAHEIATVVEAKDER